MLHQPFKAVLWSIVLLLLLSRTAHALELGDLQLIEQELQSLAQQNDAGLSQIPILVNKLNQFEAEYEQTKSQSAGNVSQLQEAIFDNKNALANYVYQAKFWSSVQPAMIALSEGTNSLSMVQKSIILNIMLGGPTAQAKQFFTDYINSDEAGGIRLRETLMYFTLHPNPEVKDRISLMANEQVHPLFRGPASWAFGKLSTSDDPQALQQLAAALNQSIGEDIGFDTKLLTLLGVAEVASVDYLKANYTSVGLDNDYLVVAKRYSRFKRASQTDKATLILNGFSGNMGRYERDEAIQFILENNRADLLSKIGVLVDGEQGLVVEENVAQLARILGYTITGSSDNPVITAI